MAQESLLRKLEEAAGRIKVLERERNEAMEKILSLERETKELRSIINLAEAKADEILKGGTPHEFGRGRAASTADVSELPPGSRGLDQLMEPSPSQQEELRRRFPHAFTPT